MSFKVGDKVGFLHEQGRGVVVGEIDNNKIIVEVDGIEIPYSIEELIDLSEMKVHTIEPEAEKFLREKIFNVRDKTGRKNKISTQKVESFIDLHIENLIDSHANLTNGQILNKQMNALKSYLEKAEHQKMNKVIIIHGVGQGVLKEEVRYYLKQFDRYEFMDAPYFEYGYGATELRIYYNY